MNRKKKCGCRYKCNCASDTIKLNTLCSTTPECDITEKCSETFDGNCVIYTGDDLVNSTAQGIVIPNGTTVNNAIQKLLSYIMNPGCNTPGAACGSVAGFKSVTISQTTAKFSWEAVTLALTYVVEYKRPQDLNWTSNPSVTVLTDTIGGLTADTQYYVRVTTNCTSGTCYSVVISITTKE